jgi:hypothetical protein
MHVILDDHLHADSHVKEDRNDEQHHDDRNRGRAQYLGNGGVIAPDQGNNNQHRCDRERNVGDCGETLPDEIVSARLRRTKAAHPAERRTHVRGTRAHGVNLLTEALPSGIHRRPTK